MASKVIVITGASSGIGAAVAQLLASKGHSIVLVSRNAAALEKIAEQCEAAGGKALVVPADVAIADDVERVALTAVKEFGAIDVWLNGASVISLGTFLDTPVEAFEKILQTNINGVVHGSRVALRHFTQQGHGTLINIASGFGAFPAPYTSPYVMSKFAVRALSGSLMQEMYVQGYKNIHICSVLPTTIDTPIYQHSPNFMGRKTAAVPPVYSLPKAAKKIARLVEHPKTEIVIGRPVRLLAIWYSLAPALFLRVLARYFHWHIYRQPEVPQSDGNLYVPSADGATKGGWLRRDKESPERKNI